MPGPAPKRSSERRRRNKTPGLESSPAAVSVVQPACPEDLHVRAQEWYRSLATSGQSAFYTASDWQVALICAAAIDMFMETGRATLLAEIRSLQSQLLTTEGERRRSRLELEREEPGDDAELTVLDDYRDALGG